MHIFGYLHTCVYMYRHTCIHVYMHNMNTCIHAYMRTYVNEYIYAWKYAIMHTSIHANILRDMISQLITARSNAHFTRAIDYATTTRMIERAHHMRYRFCNSSSASPIPIHPSTLKPLNSSYGYTPGFGPEINDAPTPPGEGGFISYMVQSPVPNPPQLLAG